MVTAAAALTSEAAAVWPAAAAAAAALAFNRRAHASRCHCTQGRCRPALAASVAWHLLLRVITCSNRLLQLQQWATDVFMLLLLHSLRLLQTPPLRNPGMRAQKLPSFSQDNRSNQKLQRNTYTLQRLQLDASHDILLRHMSRDLQFSLFLFLFVEKGARLQAAGEGGH